MNLLKGIYSYTKMGKAMNYVERVALDLIKARRQEGHTEKVYLCILSSITNMQYHTLDCSVVLVNQNQY